MKVDFKGICEQVVTFIADEAITNKDSGKTVKISDNAVVSLCSENDVPCGILLNVRNGYCSVIIRGYCKASYSVSDEAGKPNLGYCYLVADANGGVKAAAAGLRVLVVSSDDENAEIGFII